MIIRPAIPDDANGISAVLMALTAAGLRTKADDPEFALNHYIIHPDNIRCSIAVDDAGTILGFQALKLARPGNIYGVAPGWGIIGTHISPDAARQGVGKALFATTKDAAEQAKLPNIDATIGDKNAGGLAYYAAMGFATYRTMDGAICKRFSLDDKTARRP